MDSFEKFDDAFAKQTVSWETLGYAIVPKGGMLWVPENHLPLVISEVELNSVGVLPWVFTSKAEAASEGADVALRALMKHAKKHKQTWPFEHLHAVAASLLNAS